jgi:hypothetical protein
MTAHLGGCIGKTYFTMGTKRIETPQSLSVAHISNDVMEGHQVELCIGTLEQSKILLDRQRAKQLVELLNNFLGMSK